MQDVVDAGAHLLGECQIGEIAFHEFSGGNDVEILAPASDEAVGDANAMSPPQKFLREMRSDEAGSAGDEIGRQLSDSAMW